MYMTTLCAAIMVRVPVNRDSLLLFGENSRGAGIKVNISAA
jgi:hypothetical protein